MKNDAWSESPAPTEGTVRRPRLVRPPVGSAFELVVIEGADVGLTLRIDPRAGESAAFLIGSSPTCSLRIIDRNALARHCSLRVEPAARIDDSTSETRPDGLRLIDLSARHHAAADEPAHGTRVNGVFTSEALLVGGEVLRVGDTRISVRRIPSASSASWSAATTSPSSFGSVRGESLAMRELYRRLGALTSIDRGAHVLLLGERGTGKRLLARELSKCALDQREIFEEIDDVASNATSILELARSPAPRATLYLRELGDLDIDAQRALAVALHAASDERPRILAGTRGDKPLAPELLLAFGEPRRISLPPLRSRDGDVIVLARHFWAELGGEGSLPDDFVGPFDGHTWPGNVRELRIAVQDRILHGAPNLAPATEGALDWTQPRAEYHDALSRVIDRDLPFVSARSEVLAELERRYVARALERSGGNVARAAAASGIAHRYFQVLKSRRRTPTLR